MPNITYYVVLPFIRGTDGDLIAIEAVETPTESAAKRRAASWALIPEVVGAIAFSRTGDPSMGDFADAVIIGRYGETPDDAEFG
jgi:hypothetical protein